MKKTSKQTKRFVKEGEKSAQSPELKRLEGVFKLMSDYGVGELDLEDKSGRIHVRLKGDSPVGVVQAPTQTWVSPPVAPAAASVSLQSKPADVKSSESPGLPSNQKHVLSPFVGTFYRASSPGAEPYAKEGQRVRKGQILCIIEAMKLMNEIESEFDGKVVAALVENGQPVEFGEPLFIVEV